MSILVTGGAGFIGSNFVLDWLAQSDETVINPDRLTYAGDLDRVLQDGRLGEAHNVGGWNEKANVDVYLEHARWVANVTRGNYRNWMEKQSA